MATSLFDTATALGEPGMDASHEALMRALEALAGADDASFPPCFADVTERIEIDFRDEEARMEEIDYAGLHAHREQHARVLSALHHARSQVEAGEIDAGRQVIRLLPQWLQFHIWTMDSALAAALLLASDAQSNPPAAPPAPARPTAPAQNAVRATIERLQGLRTQLVTRVHEQLQVAEAREAATAGDAADDILLAMVERDLASLSEVETALRLAHQQLRELH